MGEMGRGDSAGARKQMVQLECARTMAGVSVRPPPPPPPPWADKVEAEAKAAPSTPAPKAAVVRPWTDGFVFSNFYSNF